MSTRAIGASIRTDPVFRTVPEKVIGVPGTATAGVMLVRVTAAGPVALVAVVRVVPALTATAADPAVTAGTIETARKAALAASRRTCLRL
jgi:hypothetical protein